MNYNHLLNIGKKKLSKFKVPSAALDSELLLSETLKIDRVQLLTNLDKTVGKNQINRFNRFIEKRINGEPISYLLGKKEFWKREFLVNKSVLIPRPDTELLVEKTLDLIPEQSNKKILDIGTGSGCILISILLERRNCKGIGLDISKEAIKIAKTNAKMQQLQNRIKFINSDIDIFFSNKYDVIVSNPPYIKSLKINSLDEDVKNFEPRNALDGGQNGCSKILMVIKQSSKLLKKKGYLILEIDDQLYFNVKCMLKNFNFYIKNVFTDLSGQKRCIVSIKEM